MTDLDLLGINIRRNPEWDRPFCIMGFGDIGLPELDTTLRGCALARSNGKIIALPPKVPGAHPGDLGAISWNAHGPFAAAVCSVILDGYVKMGGEMPSEPTAAQTRGANAARFAASDGRRDRVTGKPIGSDPFDEPDEPDDAGLRRALGGDAVEDTLEAAGL